MTLILLRHGQTALNAARTLQPADTPLSALGQAQARAVAQRLAGMGLAGILASDLPRALHTAQAVAQATGLPVETTPLLHERNFGDYRGRPYADFDFDVLHMPGAPPGGESVAQLHERALQALALALRRRRALAGPLLVVSHGGLLRALLAQAAAPSGEHGKHEEGLNLRNTSLTVLSEHPPHTTLLLNCTAHLTVEQDVN